MWVAFAALMFTILTVSGGGIWALFSKLEANRIALENTLSDHKENLDNEIEIIRTAAFAEYKELRHEMNDGWAKAYLEFGEGPKAMREKITQVELFMRDTYLPISRFEREQDQVMEFLKNLQTHIESRMAAFEKKLDRVLQPRNGDA